MTSAGVSQLRKCSDKMSRFTPSLASLRRRSRDDGQSQVRTSEKGQLSTYASVVSCIGANRRPMARWRYVTTAKANAAESCSDEGKHHVYDSQV